MKPRTPPAARGPVNKWLVAMTVMLPTFIEIMDTSVVNVSLPHMQGSLSAGLDEVTWVLTSYLVSNAVIIPITGWLSNVFGRKRYLIFSLSLFTVSSLVCGGAPSLSVLVLARIAQGIGGGGLQPISQAILLEAFPVEEHGMAMAVFGMGVVLAPIIGPVFGGWITDTFTWRWIFYINLPFGIAAIGLVYLFISDPPYIRRAGLRIDYLGLVLLAVWVGCLQIVLDKGQRSDWFSSSFILTLSIVAGVAFLLFLVFELTVSQPVVDLRAFLSRSFTMGNIIIFSGFLCLFASIVLLPLYVQNLMGYTSFLAGLVLGPGGLAALVSMPIAGVLMRRNVSARSLLAVGLAINAYALYLMSGFNLEADFMRIALPRAIQGFGIGLFFVPLSAATFINVTPERMGNATGIFNLVRNLGGSVGVALGTTLLERRTQLHQTMLVGDVTPYSKAFRSLSGRIAELFTSQHSAAAGNQGVLEVIYQMVQSQARMMAFNDAFWIFAIAMAVLVPLTAFFRTRRTVGGGAVMMH